MSKLRVYEFAKELNVSNKEILWIGSKIGIELKSHMSAIEDGDRSKFTEFIESNMKQKSEGEPSASVETAPIKEAPKKETVKADKKKETVKTESKKETVKKIEVKKEVPKNTKKAEPVKEGEKKEHFSPKKPLNKGKQKGNFGSKNPYKGKGKFKGKNKYQEPKEPVPEVVIKKVQLGEEILVKDLGMRLNKSSSEVIMKLMGLGVMATINQYVDFDTASLVCNEFGVEDIEFKSIKRQVEFVQRDDDPKTLEERPPIITVMGHVDHGKTSLLDAIRNASVTTSEAGGITQHIGAYEVSHNNKKITFIDTPGHAAFTAMRARGAKMTDIAILVVAADDGVMPQTIEAINHAKAAEVPIIVALNKIDKEDANKDKVIQQLMEYDLVPEAWGGSTIFCEVSAKKKLGLENLLEMILLVSEVEELRANRNRAAEGYVIEAKLDKARGVVASLLVTKGTLRIGETVLAGEAIGKARAMVNYLGERVKVAGPSTPVEVIGLSVVPEAGDSFNVIRDEKLAQKLAAERKIVNKEESMKLNQMVSLENLFDKISEGNLKDLNIIIKGDVRGSLEALAQSIMKIETDEVNVNIIHQGVGAVNESDIKLAMASDGLIIGFNVRPDANAKKLAQEENITISLYKVIYEVIDDIKQAISGLLAPELKEVDLGTIEVRQVIKVPKVGAIAGGYVLDGVITNKSKIRVVRDGIILFDGNVLALKRFKDDVKEVKTGYECGISIENFNDIKEGDLLEAYEVQSIERSL